MPAIHCTVFPGGVGTEVQHDKHPDICPQCHHAIHPQMVNAFLSSPVAGPSALWILYRCPKSNCAKLFLGVFKMNGNVYYLEACVPQAAKSPDLPKNVSQVSTSFVKIYSQALAAESFQLDEMFGVGLRKALEFLIKDYVISKNQPEADAIKKMQLGPLIDKYVSDHNLKKCAKRAAWLGNDETHYIRKWESKDVEDLKRLIQLTVNWVSNELLTDEYEKSMPDKP